jgi:hypothetical protein
MKLKSISSYPARERKVNHPIANGARQYKRRSFRAVRFARARTAATRATARRFCMQISFR